MRLATPSHLFAGFHRSSRPLPYRPGPAVLFSPAAAPPYMKYGHDLVRSFFRSKTVSLDAVSEQLSELSIPDRDVLEAVLSLPVQYKDVVYLYYYEGYSAVEIAGILHKKVNTIYTLLSRAKALLKKTLGGDDFE